MTDEQETPPEAEEIVADEELVEIETMSPDLFIQQAQEAGLSQMLDKDLDRVKEQTGVTWKQMLRGYALVLRSIAVSMPWDDEEGLDAQRFHTDAKTMLPSWRACIGRLLGLSFDKREVGAKGEVSDDGQDSE